MLNFFLQGNETLAMKGNMFAFLLATTILLCARRGHAMARRPSEKFSMELTDEFGYEGIRQGRQGNTGNFLISLKNSKHYLNENHGEFKNKTDTFILFLFYRVLEGMQYVIIE